VVAALLAAQLSGIAEAGHGGPDMKAILNAKIKRWESFRPFAPSVLDDASRTGRAFIASSSASTSRRRSSGKKYIELIWRAAATPASVKLYRSSEGKLSVTMRQTPVGSDKLFVDYAGDTVPGIVIG
jgi:hypothetical protein